MNIQINADNVYCSFSDKYQQIFLALKKELKGNDFIFTERETGAGFLQWEIPGSGGKKLSEADIFEQGVVNEEKERIFSLVRPLFGVNTSMAVQVMSVPSDDFIFFKPDAQGNVQIKLVAWGYKYPEVIGEDEELIGDGISSLNLQEAIVSFWDNGEKLLDYSFRMVGYLRQTDENGEFYVGKIPVGNSYEIETLDGKKLELKVIKGLREYRFNVTRYVEVLVRSTKDGKPYVNASCLITYNGRETEMKTNAEGKVFISLAQDKNALNDDVVVILEEQRQTKKLLFPSIEFVFEFLTPQSDSNKEEKEELESEEPIKEEDVELEPEQQQKDDSQDIIFYPRIRIENSDGKPVKSYPIRVTIEGRVKEYVSDADGLVYLGESRDGETIKAADLKNEMNVQTFLLNIEQETYVFRIEEPITVTSKKLRNFSPQIKIEGENGFIGKFYPINVQVAGKTLQYVSDGAGMVYLSMVEEGQNMIVYDLLLQDNVQTFLLNADQEIYIFKIPYALSNSANNIKIIVEDEDGKPMSGATAFFSQQDAPNTLTYLDGDGVAFVSRDDYKSKVPFSLTLTVKNEKYAQIIFELVDDDDVYLLRAVKKTSIWKRLLEILMFILGLILVYCVYLLYMKILFG